MAEIPSETKTKSETSESAFIVPNHVKGNIRETIQFDNLGKQSDTYNTAGVRLDDPYNAFYRDESNYGKTKKDLDGEKRRRVRTNDKGEIEELIKLSNGDFMWSPRKAGEYKTPTPEKIKTNPENPIQSSEVLEAVAQGIDQAENTNERQDDELAQMKAEIADIRKTIRELRRSMGQQVDDEESTEEPNGDPTEASQPGKEIELYTGNQADQPEGEASENEVDGNEEAEGDEPHGPKYPGQELMVWQAEEREDELPPAFETMIPEELSQQLIQSRDKYAELTAKHRRSVVGHFLHNSTYLRNFGWAKKLGDWANDTFDNGELDKARQEYKDSVLSIQKEVHRQCFEQFIDINEAIEQTRIRASQVAIESEVGFEMKLAAERAVQSGPTNAFINWWVRNDSLGNRIKKVGILTGAGIAAGAIAGLAGAPLWGVAVGGAAAGVGVARYITKKRAAGAMQKDGTEILTNRQMRESVTEKGNRAQTQLNNNEFVDIDGMTDLTESDTADEKARNRRRQLFAAGAGAGAAAVGGLLGEASRDALEGLDGAPSETPKNTQPPTVADRLDNPTPPEAPQAPEFEGTTFDVEADNGYTHELIDFAKANGHKLNANQSFELHKALVDQFGQDYIDIKNQAQDVYQMGAGEYNVGLTVPGKANWDPGVTDFIKNWMSTRNLW